MSSINVTVVPNTITVDYEEIHGFRIERWGQDAITGSRKLKCAWDDRHQLAQDLRGYLRNSGNGVIYMKPQSMPGYDNLYVKDVTIEPFNTGTIESMSDNKVLEYEYAALLVEYENIGNIDGDDDDDDGLNPKLLITESLQTGVEFLTISNRKLYWDTNGQEPIDIDEAPGIMVHMLEWIYTINFMPYIPSEAISLVGYVNNSTVSAPSLDVSFNAETLLYKGCEPSRNITDQGVQAWEITYRFSYRPQGWNYFPKAGGGTYSFYPIYNENGVQEYPYPLANLNPLLLS